MTHANDDHHSTETSAAAEARGGSQVLMDSPALAREPWGQELKILLLLAGPNVASTAAETMLSFVDYAIVSQLGAQAQAAVQCGGMVFFTVFAVMIGIMTCVSTTVSQSLGAKRPLDCSVYAWQGIWISMTMGLVGVLLWPVVPHLFGLFGHEPAVQEMEIAYTRIRLLSLGPAAASGAVGHFFIGVHQPTTNTISVVIGNVANAFLSYGLVLGKFGLPAMGIEGAAWGTVIASFFRWGMLMAAMFLSPRTRQFQAWRGCRFDSDKMRRLVRIGWPAGAAFLFDIAAWAVFMNAIIGRFGTVHMAATSTCWRFLELSFMPAVGVGMAVSSLVGKAIGETRPELARQRARLGLFVCSAYMMLMAIVYVTLGRQMMGLFTDHPDVIAIGAELMIFMAVFQFFDATAINYSCALRGAGDTRWPAIAGAGLAWSIMVGGGMTVALYRPEFGSRGPWSMATLFVLAIGTTLYARWRSGVWEHIDVIGRTEPQPQVDYDPSPTETVAAQIAVPPEYVADAEPIGSGESSP